MITIRRATHFDNDRIIDLFNREFPEYQRSPKYLDWFESCFSDSESIVCIAEHKNKVIGHYRVSPKLINIKDKTIKAGFGSQAIVDKKFKNKVSIMQITSLAYKISKGIGIEFIFGFPNNNYSIIQEKIEKWIEICRFKSIEFNVKQKPSNNISCVEFSKLTDKEALESIVFCLEQYGNHSIPREAKYYLKRYDNKYKKYFIYENNDLCGMFVTKDYKKVKYHMVDFLVDKNKLDVLWDCFLATRTNNNISLWLCGIIDQNFINDKVKNISHGFQTNFMFKMLSDNKNIKKDISNFNNWCIKMGDSDAF